METDVNVARKYKSRKERPCDNCRKRKICCTRDANEKDCSLCRTRGESCTYILPPNARLNRKPVAHERSSPSSASSAHCPIHSRPRLAREVAPSEWSCQIVGLSGDQDPYVLRHCSFNHLGCYNAPDWAILTVKADDGIPLHFTAVPDTHLDARPRHYPDTDTEEIVAPHSSDLLRTYFEVIHASYPLLDPSRLNGRPTNGDLLRAVVYFLAAPYSHGDLPDFQNLEIFIHQALPISDRAPLLSNLEASLLFIQRPLSPSHSLNSLPALSSTIGGLVGTAYSLGLNHSPLTWSLSPADTSRRIRIWWALYIADKWTALALGRPSHLHAENSTVPMINISNFPHTGFLGGVASLQPALLFVAMANLTAILSDILDTFYTPKAAERIRLLPPEVLINLMENYRVRLRHWREEHLLPLLHNSTPSNSLGLNNSRVHSTGTVILAFHTLEVCLLREVLRVLPPHHPGWGSIRGFAKGAVVAVVEFVEKLDADQVKAFWWSPTTPHSLALIGAFLYHQLLTSTTNFDVDYYSNMISRYRSLLRMQADSFGMARLACARMDSLARGLGIEAPTGEQIEEEAWARAEEGERMPGSAEEWISRPGFEGMLS